MPVPLSSGWSGKLIGQDELTRLKQMAREAPTRRARTCLHQTHDDTIQEMLIALLCDSIVHPHRQQNKSKSYTVIEGSLTVTYYDESGNAVHEVEMGASDSDRVFVIRFPSDQWHTVRAESPLVIYLETITGPYRQEETEWAPWASDDQNRVS